MNDRRFTFYTINDEKVGLEYNLLIIMPIKKPMTGASQP